MGVQYFVAIGPAEAFGVGVLVRLAGLDVAQFDAVVATPVDYRLGGVFRAVVAADRPGQTAPVPELLQHPDDPFGSQAGVDLDSQGFPDALIQNIQGPEPPP